MYSVVSVRPPGLTFVFLSRPIAFVLVKYSFVTIFPSSSVICVTWPLPLYWNCFDTEVCEAGFDTFG